MALTLPEALVPLAWLVGEWHGEGRGEYPTITDFTYREHSSFAQLGPGQPVLAYAQRTWLLPDESSSHAETGYLRGVPGDRAELVVAQPSGRVEVAEGTVAGGVIELTSIVVAGSATAKSVTDVRRRIERRGDDTLWYRLDMAAVGKSVLYHCEATLTRVST